MGKDLLDPGTGCKLVPTVKAGGKGSKVTILGDEPGINHSQAKTSGPPTSSALDW